MIVNSKILVALMLCLGAVIAMSIYFLSKEPIIALLLVAIVIGVFLSIVRGKWLPKGNK